MNALKLNIIVEFIFRNCRFSLDKLLCANICIAIFILPVHANENKIELEQKLVMAGDKLISQIVWPEESNKIGFKSMVIGDVFDIGDSKNTYPHDPSSNINVINPFNCHANSISPILECGFILWNDDSRYSKAHRDLGVAFGDKVNLSFNTILLKTPSNKEINSHKFGAGKIARIEITNDNPSPDFVTKSVRYFSDNLNAKPFVKTSYLKPEGVFSANCLKVIKRVEGKPISELSLKDNNSYEKCNNEASLRILTGKALSGRYVIYSWNEPESLYKVVISSSELKMNVGDAGTVILPSDVSIVIEINQIDKVVAWKKEIEKIEAEFETEKNNKSKSDF